MHHPLIGFLKRLFYLSGFADGESIECSIIHDEFIGRVDKFGETQQVG